MERIIDRFDKYMKFRDLNDNKVTEQLSLSIGLLGKSRKEGRELSKNVVNSILKFYDDIEKVWLLTGEGKMLSEKDNSMNDELTIPLLPISAQAGSLNDFLVSVKDTECEQIISPIKGADFAITVAGESMSPEFTNGSQVLVKRINEKAFIDWGKVFVLDTCNGTVIKIIVPSKVEGCVRCQSINPDPRFAPFDVNLNDVFGIYRVMLCMSIK